MASPRTHTQRQRDRFPLAAALFPRFPAAEECDPPQQHAPDSWLLSFREHHADAEVLAGLFTSCPAGRDYVLETADTATVKLDTTTDQTSFQWLAQFRAVKHSLIMRGSLPTSLSLTATESQASAAACALLLEPLSGAAGSLYTLELHHKLPPSRPASQHNPTQPFTNFLQHAGQTFTGLISLVCEHSSCSLPPPSRFPRLRHMRYRDLCASEQTVADVCSSIAAYLPQLYLLELDHRTHHLPWPVVFQHTSYTLTHFIHQYESVDDILLQLMITHAPNLTHLHVGGFRLRSWDQGDKQWGVTEVQFGHDTMDPFNVITLNHVMVCGRGHSDVQRA